MCVCRYKATIQWRFINRAIDEVENNNCPAIILICRNSTDTAYFHRLMPYPRILLRRSSIQFKDYDNSPIGFGVVIFCITKEHSFEYNQRFYNSFSAYGEMNMPVDSEMVRCPSFHMLVKRLRLLASKTQRDNWIQCDKCKKWRHVCYSDYVKLEKQDPNQAWTCSTLASIKLKGGCHAPQTSFEIEAQEWNLYSVKNKKDKMLLKLQAESQRQNSRKGDGGDSDSDEDDTNTTESLGIKYVVPLNKILGNSGGARAQATEAGGGSGSNLFLTPLELARTARVAGNKKLLKTLGLYSKRTAMQPVAPNVMPPGIAPAGYGAHLYPQLIAPASASNANANANADGKKKGKGEGKSRAKMSEGDQARLSSECLPHLLELKKMEKEYEQCKAAFLTRQQEVYFESIKAHKEHIERNQNLHQLSRHLQFCEKRLDDLHRAYDGQLERVQASRKKK